MRASHEVRFGEEHASASEAGVQPRGISGARFEGCMAFAPLTTEAGFGISLRQVGRLTSPLILLANGFA